jgi:hypothetical protein
MAATPTSSTAMPNAATSSTVVAKTRWQHQQQQQPHRYNIARGITRRNSNSNNTNH